MNRLSYIGALLIFCIPIFTCCSSKDKLQNNNKVDNIDTITDIVKVDSTSDSTSVIIKAESPVRIGVAWRRDTTSSTFRGVIMAIKECGAIPVVLNLQKSPKLTYSGNKLNPRHEDIHGVLRHKYAEIVKEESRMDIGIADSLSGIDAMIFPGGEDMSPTLFAVPEYWHGIKSEKYYDSTRDVSDYLLMRWCLDHDMPTLCICRGMQVLCILSDVPLIQDLATYFRQRGKAYNHAHRAQTSEGRRFARHDVKITDRSSLLYQIADTDLIHNAPSWHHQSAKPFKDGKLKLTAVTTTNGIDVIEGVERTDKTFFVGVQYHPEISVKKTLEHAIDAPFFMSYEEGMQYFYSLKEAAKKSMENNGKRVHISHPNDFTIDHINN